MIGPLNPLWILIALVRIFAYAGNRSRSAAVDPAILWRLVLVVTFCGGAIASLALVEKDGFASGTWASIGVTVALGLFAFPGVAANALFVPLGLARMAWAIDRAGGGTWSSQARAMSGLLVAARAIARQRRPDPASLAFVEKRLGRALELRGDGVVAAAELALARGDRDRARSLCEALAEEHRFDVPRMAFRLAREILVVDAAERGDWHGALRLASQRRTKRTVELLRRVAARLVGEVDRPSKAALVFSWLVAPRRRRSWPIVRRALSAPPYAPPPLDEDPLAAHRALVARGPDALTPAALQGVCGRVDVLRRDPALVAMVARRALALGAELEAESVRDELVRAIEGDLARLVLAARLPLTRLGSGATLVAVRERVRQERLARLDTLARDLKRRDDGRIDLPEVDEWCALQEVRVLAEALWHDADPEERPAIFRTVFFPVCNFAVRIANVRGRRFLARLTFRWLLSLATAGDMRADADLLARNVSSCEATSLSCAKDMVGERIGGGERGVRLGLAWAILGGTVTMTEWAWWPPAPGAFVGACLGGLAVGALAILAVSRRLATTYVDAALTPDGLLVERRPRRWNVPFEDLASVANSRVARHAVVLRLRRAPAWLGRTLRIATLDPEGVRQIEAQLAAHMRGGTP